jgi:hypothetical protein
MRRELPLNKNGEKNAALFIFGVFFAFCGVKRLRS